ncbi:MAG TPA: hypothetical protein VKV05_03565 [Terriglobales bacterium]|nr:hypothetical protein [Terriglobales bacterium]
MKNLLQGNAPEKGGDPSAELLELRRRVAELETQHRKPKARKKVTRKPK